MPRLGNSGKTSRQSALMMRLMKLAGGVGATAMGGSATVPGDGMSAVWLMACLLWDFQDERAGRALAAGSRRPCYSISLAFNTRCFARSEEHTSELQSP